MADNLSAARIKRPKPSYPPNHKAAMQVPKGGSSCSSCRFVSHDLHHCANKHFVHWNRGNPKLPFPADSYCSDWYEPKKGAL